MTNFFSTLKVYGVKWSVVSSRKLNNEEKSSIKEAVVVDSDYGLSVCFFLKKGGTVYNPLDRDADYETGEILDIDNIEIVTLEREGVTKYRIK